VNGVAEIHTNLLRNALFPDFSEMWPDKFENITNGVNARRWLLQANPALSAVISKWVGNHEWIHDLGTLASLRRIAFDPELQRDWREAKRYNKRLLAAFIDKTCGIAVDSSAMFDVQVKRIHEYKRQFMNILSVAYRYLRLLSLLEGGRAEEVQRVVPRVVIFAGKAAADYVIAKDVIRMILDVAETINGDDRIGNLLKVVFIPNYNVSLAEVLIPGADVSQQISTAGMEASGTSNMKFAMNGALLLGSRDGANLEIESAIGRDNIFMFGATAKEVERLRSTMQYRKPQMDSRLKLVLEEMAKGRFGARLSQDGPISQLIDTLKPGKDTYMVGHDFGAYLEANEVMDCVFRQEEQWTAKCIASCCAMSRFSSDRCIREYAEKIWEVQPHQFQPPAKPRTS